MSNGKQRVRACLVPRVDFQTAAQAAGISSYILLQRISKNEVTVGLHCSRPFRGYNEREVLSRSRQYLFRALNVTTWS